MATVKNEFPLWPQASVFAESALASANHWQMEPANSPLSDYFQMLQPEDDLISLSSLETSPGSFQSSGFAEEDEDSQMFSATTGFPVAPVVVPPPIPQPFNSPVFTPPLQQHQDSNSNILLHSVIKSKLESIETHLLSDDDTSSSSDSSTITSLDHHQHHQQQQQQQMLMMPPPPPPVQRVQPTPVHQESLGTIRSFDFQSRAVPPGVTFPPPALPPVNRPLYYSPAGGEDPQVLLVHLLVMCAHAVAGEDFSTAEVILVQLRQFSSPSGTPMQRLATYFSEALAARAESRADPGGISPRSSSSPLFKGLVSDKLLESDGSTQASMLEAFSTFYDYLPIGKFDHLTMNQVIIDAVERERAIHILDLQVWFGTQWPALLQALATRPGGPPRVRITTVGKSAHDLEATRLKLKDCARALRVNLEFHVLQLGNLVDEFDASLVELRPGEAFIVNSLSQFHYLLSPGGGSGSGSGRLGVDDSDSKFARFMQQVRSLRPKVLVMAENDASHNSPDFLRRFGECLKYYSAVFDAMATCASSPAGRLKMERLFAAPKIRNIVACEGLDRVERHESMADWAKRLESAGFRPLPLSQRAINQARLLLRLYYTNGYSLYSERGYLVLGWRNLPLNTVSAWRLG